MWLCCSPAVHVAHGAWTGRARGAVGPSAPHSELETLAKPPRTPPARPCALQPPVQRPRLLAPPGWGKGHPCPLPHTPLARVLAPTPPGPALTQLRSPNPKLPPDPGGPSPRPLLGKWDVWAPGPSLASDECHLWGPGLLRSASHPPRRGMTRSGLSALGRRSDLL